MGLQNDYDFEKIKNEKEFNSINIFELLAF